MFNVTILKMKDIIKYFVGTIITVIVVFLISTSFKTSNQENKIVANIENSIKSLSEKNFLSCLNQTLPVLSNVNEEYNTIFNEEDINSESNNILEEILKTQISSIKQIEKENLNEEVNGDVAEETASKDQETNKETDKEEKQDESNNIQTVQTGLKTEIITQNPIAESYNVQYGNVKIKNQTKYQLTEDILKPDISIENKNVIIFHTHSCESYTSSDAYSYTPTGNYRTTDLNYSVTRVGTELESQLKQYNFNVLHDTNYHDYPSYNGSYTRSLQTVENILQTTPSDIIIDVHRDAVGSRSDYAPTVKIGDTDVAAQIMFVIGTNEGGLWHPNWNQNLKFAIKIQEKAEEMYPGLFKPIMLTTYRYNQHTGKYANIIEVGATRKYFRTMFNKHEISSKSNWNDVTSSNSNK